MSKSNIFTKEIGLRLSKEAKVKMMEMRLILSMNF